MQKKSQSYQILVHCTLPQIRCGFEASISLLPFEVKTNYADLSLDGIVSHLRTQPDLIVILLSQGDSAFGLPLKIKLFADRTPLLVVLPAVPERYYHALRAVGVDRVVELPIENEHLCNELISLLKSDRSR